MATQRITLIGYPVPTAQDIAQTAIAHINYEIFHTIINGLFDDIVFAGKDMPRRNQAIYQFIVWYNAALQEGNPEWLDCVGGLLEYHDGDITAKELGIK